MENKVELVKSISKDVTKQGIKSLLVLIGVGLLFILFNLLFVIGANFDRALREGVEFKTILIELLVGVIFTIVALLMTKKYLVVNLVKLVYKYLSPFIQKLSISLFENIYDKGIQFTKHDKISKFVNVGQLWKDAYDVKVPSGVQKGVNMILNQVPYASLILDVKAEIDQRVIATKESTKTEACNLLHEQIDLYVQESILKTNHFYTTLILFAVNVVVQFLLAYLL